ALDLRDLVAGQAELVLRAREQTASKTGLRRGRIRGLNLENDKSAGKNRGGHGDGKDFCRFHVISYVGAGRNVTSNAANNAPTAAGEANPTNVQAERNCQAAFETSNSEIMKWFPHALRHALLPAVVSVSLAGFTSVLHAADAGKGLTLAAIPK